MEEVMFTKTIYDTVYECELCGKQFPEDYDTVSFRLMAHADSCPAVKIMKEKKIKKFNPLTGRIKE